ncbi:MAG: TonB-dependent receptor [Verrucomicrobiota bacterium]
MAVTCTLLRLRRFAVRRVPFLVALVLSSALSVAAPDLSRKVFDLPRDRADRSLKRFSEQSGLEIIFSARVAQAVETQAVKGEMLPSAALAAMLAHTGLEAVQEPTTGALSIRPLPAGKAKKADRAALAPDSRDRPGPHTAAPAPSSTPTMTTNRPSSPVERVLGALAAFIVGGAPAAAQTPSAAPGAPTQSQEVAGSVVGQISNEATKDYLPGATVEVEGTRLIATSEEGGYYRLSLPTGSHLLIVRYTGLTIARIPVTVQGGQTTRTDIALTSDTYKLEPVTVTGIREGSAAAIARQREAMNVKNVVAIDAYGNPAASIGELLQRLPGVAVDLSGGGETGAIYIRGMNQSFGTMAIDGNQMPVSDGQTVGGKYVYLGQVTSGNVESVELIKAALPEMDGNAISGYLNLRTKRAFDRAPGRNIGLSVATKWTDTTAHSSLPGKDTPGLDVISLSYSDVLSVLGRRNNLGILAQLNLTKSATTIEEAGPFLASSFNHYFIAEPVGGAPLQPLPTYWSSGHWSGSGKPSYVKGVTFNTDYKLSDDASLYFKSTYNNSKYKDESRPSYLRWQVVVPTNITSFEPGSTWEDTTTRPVGTVDLHSTLYGRWSESYTLAAGFERKLFAGRGLLTLDGSYSDTTAQYPAINEVHAQLTGVAFRLDRRGRDEWHPAITQVGGRNWSDPASYTMRSDSRIIHFRVPSSITSAKMDYKHDLETSVPAYLKVGMKRAAEKKASFRYVDSFTWAGSTTGGIAPWVGYNAVMGDGNYGPFPMLEIPTTGLPGDAWANPGNWFQTPTQAYNSLVDELAGRVQTREEITAAYIQAQVRLGRLRILSGVRVEETEASGAGFRRKAADATNNANNALSIEQNRARALSTFTGWVEQTADYRDVFPGVHLVYNLANGLQARTSYNVSITRPSAANYAPGYVVNDIARSISANNVALRPYTSDNFEAGLAYYFEPVGSLTASVFLKEISNYTRNIPTTVGDGPDNGFNGDYAGYSWNRTTNVGAARVRGAEFSYQQQYTFLPGALRGLGFFANLTWLQTKGDFGGLTTVTVLPNLTPRTWNTGLTFRGYGFSLRLLANHRSQTYIGSQLVSGSAPVETNSIYGRGSGGIIGQQTFDWYNKARTMLDFKAEYTINRTYSAYLDVYNLTNEWNFERVARAFGFESPWTAQHTGMAFTLGVKARF